MKTNQQQVTLAAAERKEILAHEPGCNVVVQRFLFSAHAVPEQRGGPVHEWNGEKLFGLAAQGALKHGLQPPLQLCGLLGKNSAIVVAEDLAEGREPT